MSRNSERSLAVYPTLNLVLFPNPTLFPRKESLKAEGKGTQNFKFRNMITPYFKIMSS